ncbi:DUF2793 domain-containing protein [Falsirhodobacter algicola]|uniref:DUF2793 domain-containing protein n=1 Tax=Falsirhodobacter algicola TaxID=2692330 RepID=A0A8J8MTF1_9RHOB|nr:DUF2793 domain-containing protein [Falsirhodobacter algicola]QUS36081.1 DUF2793 domain-containing protein [Falsirhodobacter algicola]
MPDTTTILGLPLLQPAQAQKHVTHNEALLMLDALVQPAVAERRSDPPPAPEDGDRILVGDDPTAAFAAHAQAIAVRQNGSWSFLAPRPGWRVHVLDTAEDLLWDGTAWTGPGARALTAARLGIGTEADDVNRLALRAEASLFTHAGAGHQLKVNKASAAQTASLLFQSAWSGRAEIGLAGTDDLSMKVSADGGTWTEALRLSGRTGLMTGAAVQTAATDTAAGRLMTVGAFGNTGAVRPDTAADLNDMTGIHRRVLAATGTANRPDSAAEWIVDCAISGTVTIQTAREVTTAAPRTAIRCGTNGVWSAWSFPLAIGRAVGKVSQTAGTATGALMEKGSNANGEYVRLADGMQICTSPTLTFGAVTTAQGTLYRSGDSTWTFPAEFASADKICVSGQSSNSARWMSGNLPGTTSVVLRLMAATSFTGSEYGRALAIGRWY